jgi:hypothetical protein
MTAGAAWRMTASLEHALLCRVATGQTARRHEVCMIDTDHFDADAYVAAVAPSVGLVFEADRQRAVAEALRLVCRIGAPALAVTPPAGLEPAAVFTP